MKQRAEKKIYMEKLGKRAVSAKETVAFLNVIQRQEGLILAADALAAQQAYIIEENQDVGVKRVCKNYLISYIVP